MIQKDTCTPMFIAALTQHSQDLEATRTSINKGMGKEDVVYVYPTLCINGDTQNCGSLISTALYD